MRTAVICALLFVTGLRSGPPAPRTPVLVELFTSEGCSSCPPADAMLASLHTGQPVAAAEIVALELHVDYWDRLGWKDPFSSRAFTDRQEAYSRALGGAEVFTPQMVVDGRDHMVGSDRSEAVKAITAAAGRPHLPLAVSARLAGPALRMTIDLPAAPRDGEAIDVFAAVTEDDLTSVVRRGENGGRTLKHMAVVRKLQTLGSLEPQAFVAEGQWKIERGWMTDRLRAVVWLQGRQTKQVYGAATQSLNSARR
jgi:hypothetical protein